MFNFLRLRFEHKRIRVNQYRRVFARAWLKFRFGEEETNLCVIRNAVRSDHFFQRKIWNGQHAIFPRLRQIMKSDQVKFIIFIKQNLSSSGWSHLTLKRPVRRKLRISADSTLIGKKQVSFFLSRASIGIFQKMRIKNLRGSVRSDFKKLDSFTMETSKNHLIRSFLRNGRVRVK